MEHETAVYEVRTWCVTGDLVGCAYIYKRGAWFTVELDSYDRTDKLRKKGFRNIDAALGFAKERAECYMSEAIADMVERYGEDDENPYAEDFHIQEVEY